MSAEENKAIARRLYETFSSENLDALDELIAPDAVNHNPGPEGQIRGPEAARQVISSFRQAFPDLQMTPEQMIAEGDKVVSYVVGRGTHQGELQGLPPTGKQVVVPVIEILRIANGKVAERWGVVDIMGMMQQLGAIPAPGR